MESCHENLEQIIINRFSQNQRFTEDEIRLIFGNLMNAIKSLHSQNIVHLDIKPDNILLRRSNKRTNQNTYVLGDFSMAIETQTVTDSSYIEGDLRYQAPELMNYECSTDLNLSKLDVYSLGLLIFELMQGIFIYLHIR